MRNVLIAALLLAAAPASAQSRTGEWVRTVVEGRQTRHSAVLLARLMVSEGGWDGTADHAAVAWTITRRLEILARLRRPVRTIDGAILRYAAGFRPGWDRSPRQTWIMALRGDGGPPAGIRWAWSRARPRSPARADAWKAALERSRRHLRGELDLPCATVPAHWGSQTHPVDAGRAERAVREGRWARVQCPGARNGYYRVLRRRRPGVVVTRSGHRVRLVPGATRH